MSEGQHVNGETHRLNRRWHQMKLKESELWGLDDVVPWEEAEIIWKRSVVAFKMLSGMQQCALWLEVKRLEKALATEEIAAATAAQEQKRQDRFIDHARIRAEYGRDAKKTRLAIPDLGQRLLALPAPPTTAAVNDDDDYTTGLAPWKSRAASSSALVP